jgi:ABC-2 type transport system ATP-binding protein
VIECTALCKSFSGKQAVRNVSLSVPDGQIFGFLGPNGAGKTTTMQMMVGLLRPDSGTIRIGGYDIVRQPIETKRMLGYVPDSPHLYEKLTARDYLEFRCRMYGVPAGIRRARIDALLERFGLAAEQHQLLGSYSHGMRQKTALAGALVHEPHYLFLDEPHVGLDPRTARTLRDVLSELAASGRAVFLSTHILEIAQHICHSVAIIDHGEVVAQGTLSDLQRQSHMGNRSLEDIFIELTEQPATVVGL